MKGWTWFVLSMLLFSGAVSCRGCEEKPTQPDQRDSEPPPPIQNSAQPAGSRFTSDALWNEALDGDPLDLATLADREGAAGLVERLDDGGQVGWTALRALPHAQDARLAYRRLGELALRTEGEVQRSIIDTVARIAQQPNSLGEALDPQGERSCRDALMEIAQRDSVESATRNLALSTARLMTQQRDPQPIPSGSSSGG